MNTLKLGFKSEYVVTLELTQATPRVSLVLYPLYKLKNSP